MGDPTPRAFLEVVLCRATAGAPILIRGIIKAHAQHGEEELATHVLHELAETVEGYHCPDTQAGIASSTKMLAS